MSRTYTLSRLAKQDMLDIWDYVDRAFGEVVADRVIDDLETAFGLLAEQPGVGRERPDLAPPRWRLLPKGPSLIVYRRNGNDIVVSRIVRAEREMADVRVDDVS